MSADLIGRRVKIAQWDYVQFLAVYGRQLPICRIPRGRVTHIEMIGEDDGDVWVQIDGLDKEFAFGPNQLEVLE